MPQRGDTVDPSAFDALGEALTGGGAYGKQRFEREKFDYQQKRDTAREDIEQKRFQLQQQAADRANQLQQQQLGFKQQEDARQQQELAFRQAEELRKQQEADYQDYLHTNPQQKPPEPQLPPKPSYENLGVNPDTLYDQPEEIDKLNQSLMLDVGRRLQRKDESGNLAPYQLPQAAAKEDGSPGAIQPITDIPIDTVNQIKTRYFELVQAGVPAIEAQQAAENELLGAHPVLRAPTQPTRTGGFLGFGGTEVPGSPGGIDPDTATIVPKRSVDPSQGYKARQKAIDDDYAARMKAWEAQRKAYDAWQPAPYPGYPWRQRRADGGAAVPAPAAPGVPTVPGSHPQPQPNVAPQAAQPRPKRMVTKGGNVLEFD